jgi:hypothetical protein
VIENRAIILYVDGTTLAYYLQKIDWRTSPTNSWDWYNPSPKRLNNQVVLI